MFTESVELIEKQFNRYGRIHNFSPSKQNRKLLDLYFTESFIVMEKSIICWASIFTRFLVSSIQNSANANGNGFISKQIKLNYKMLVLLLTIVCTLRYNKCLKLI